MQPLFLSRVCDWCDGLVDFEYESGFVVLPEEPGFGWKAYYVFPTRTDAAIWRAAQGLQHLPVVEVCVQPGVDWRRSTGTLDLDLAPHTFVIYPDHRFPPARDRAFVAPKTE